MPKGSRGYIEKRRHTVEAASTLGKSTLDSSLPVGACTVKYVHTPKSNWSMLLSARCGLQHIVYCADERVNRLHLRPIWS